jgi:uncharacterized protein
MHRNHLRPASWLLAIALAASFAPRAAAEVTVDDPGTFVVDKASVIDTATKEKLEGYLDELQRKTTAQVKVLTVPTTDGEDIFAFAQRHFERWKLGQRGKDNGVLIVVAVKDHKVWIHTGYGLEGALPDSWEGTLSRKIRDQYFREGRYSDGILEMALAVANKVADEQGVKLEGVPPVRHRAKEPMPPVFFCGLFLVLIILFWLLNLRQRNRYRSAWGGNLGPVAWGSTFGGGSPWSGGGGFGGGFGGGMGGGGSFGGGGDSGGGGAGASW